MRLVLWHCPWQSCLIQVKREVDEKIPGLEQQRQDLDRMTNVSTREPFAARHFRSSETSPFQIQQQPTSATHACPPYYATLRSMTLLP